MLHYNRIGLFSAGRFVGDGIQGSFDLVDGHSDFLAVVDTYPPEPHCFQFALEFGVHANPFPVLEMDQGNSKFRAVVVFPEILAQTFECAFNRL